MRAIMRIVLAAAALAVLLASAPQDESGFVPLFNGRDLSGWVNVNCAPTTWTVRFDMIYSTGKPICELRTARMFENFILELEYQHLDAQGNAGVFIWGDALTAPGQPFVRAIEVQILDGRNTDNYTSHGDVFAIDGARMTPRPATGRVDAKASERTSRVQRRVESLPYYRADGRHQAGRQRQAGIGWLDSTPRKGYIDLESEAGRVLYRNLRVKECRQPTSLAPDLIAQADSGFVPLTRRRLQRLAGP